MDALLRKAECHCGKLTITVSGAPRLVGACHCQACQRRTGGPVGMGAFFENRQIVERQGPTSTFTRKAASGATLTFHFCPGCGSNLFWTRDSMPDVTAVALGGFADPHFPGPSRVVWAEHRHDWMDDLAGLPHHPRAPV